MNTVPGEMHTSPFKGDIIEIMLASDTMRESMHEHIHEHKKLPYTISDHWSISVSVLYTD